MENWADKISTLEAAGWSQKSISDVIGITPQAISDIKNGRTKKPTGMAAVRLHVLYTARAKSEASNG